LLNELDVELARCFLVFKFFLITHMHSDADTYLRCFDTVGLLTGRSSGL